MPLHSPLATPGATRAVLEEFGLATKKRLGQNFLVSDAVIGNILELAELGPEDRVLEVGPGIGTLSIALLAHAGQLLAVEADPELPAVLEHTLADGWDRFSLVQGDALRVPQETLAAFAPNKFVANLPYQVAATLILKYLSQLDSLERCVVMVQAEVADRICAAPGSKAYGAYTAKLALWGRVQGRFEVSPNNFMPPPHVDSSVVRIFRTDTPDADGRVPSEQEKAFCAQVIDAAFAQRRKTIRNSMMGSGFAAQLLDSAFQRAGIDAKCRAETLSVQDFLRLSYALAELADTGTAARTDGTQSQDTEV